MLARTPRPEKPSEMAARVERDLAAKLEQARASGLQLVPTPDGNAASPALAAALWAIHDAGATPRPGVKPWRYLPCGCRTDGQFPCVQHDLTLATFWERNKISE